MRGPVTLVLALTFAGACLLPGSAAGAPQRDRVWHPHVEAAREYARGRTGDVTFAVRTPGRFAGFRAERSMSSASVVKAMLMVAYLNRKGVRGRALDDGDRELLAPMIQRSRNAAANRVYGIVGAGGLYRVAGRVGMLGFTTMPVWGGSQITARDQTKLFLRFERFVVARHRDTALRLLGSIVSRQRWGFGRIRPKGWALYFKGGWTSQVEHQVGLYRRGSRRISIAVLTGGNPSSAYGRETQRGIAWRLLRGLGPDSRLR